MAEQNGIRLNKFIADSGVCSRRDADRLIQAGRVSINGVLAETGQRVLDTDEVFVDSKPVKRTEEKVYLAFYKPRGITCTADRSDPNNVIDYLNYPVRLTYCGRLDKDSEGLLILTNDGDIINKMMKAKNGHDKEYLVKVDKKVTKGFLKRMAEGVYLEELDVTSRPCKVETVSEDNSFRIILTQGLNRQIRRMCDALDFHVLELKRIRVMNILLGNLKAGEYRTLSKSELNELMLLLKDSVN